MLNISPVASSESDMHKKLLQLGKEFPEIQEELLQSNIEGIGADKICDQSRFSHFLHKVQDLCITDSLMEVYPTPIREILLSKNTCESFNLDFFPDSLKRSILAKSESTQAHPIILAASTIATLSGFIQKKCCIPESEFFQRLYPNLWMAVIQPSGSFKTTALNKGAYLAHKTLDQINKKIKELEPDPKKNITSENKNAQQEETKNHLKRNILLPNRATGPGLLQHLADGHGGVILCSELGEWLSVLEHKYNADLKGLLTDLYDVPKQYIYKTSTSGTLTIQEPFISICGMSTIEWIQPYVNSTDLSSGFFARFLFFLPPSDENHVPDALPRTCQYIDEEAENRLQQILQNITSPIEYRLSPGAKRAFTDIHNTLYVEARSYNENSKSILSPFLKRWPPTLLKLAMIMQLIENPLQAEIGDQAIAAAWSFLESAVKSTVLLFEKELGESNFQRKCSKVKDYLGRKNGKIDRRTLLKSKVLENGSKEYDPVIMHLIETGELIEIPNSDGKKDRTVYQLLLHQSEKYR